MTRFFALVVLCGLAYGAYTVPIHGRTVVQRAFDASPWEIVRKKPAHSPTASTDGSKKLVSNDKSSPENITQADRDALARLIPH